MSRAVRAVAAVLCLALAACPTPGPGDGTPPATGGPPTFADVAPIIHRSCTPCHRSGGAAPFPLVTHDDVKRHAREMASVVPQRFMPPWLPSPGYGVFADDRRLADADVAAITKFLEAGAPVGDPAKTPAPPPLPEGWQLGEPDLVVELAEPYALGEGGEDVFRNFVVPVTLERSRHVEAVDLLPSTPRVVHHAVLRVDRGRGCRRLDAETPGAGWDSMRWGDAEPPDGRFVGFTPGRVPRREPDLAWRLDPGADLVLQLHLVPSGKPERVGARLGLYLTDAEPARRAVVVSVGSQRIDIPAGATDHTVRGSYQLPVDVDIISVYPHAHWLGRRITAMATPPGAAPIPLLRIDDWDLRWQDEYRYASPVRLPKGTVIATEIVFDNSETNFRNPTRPPRRVRYGPRATDEMAEVIFQVVPVAPGDGPALRRDVERQALQDTIAAQRDLLAESPHDAALLTSLGLRLLKSGKPAEALPLLERARTASPESASALLNVGVALQASGQVDAAESRYAEALRRDPHYVQAALNLANLHLARGRPGPAADLARAAIGWDPSSAAAHEILGLSLNAERRAADAAASFRTSLRLRPDHAPVHYALGNALAALGQYQEAAASYEQALALEPDFAEAHQNLGTALVRLGRPDDARIHFVEAGRLRPGWGPPREGLAKLP